MKTLSKPALFLALALGFCISTVSPAWAQQNETFSDTVSPGTLGPNVVGTFPIETHPRVDVATGIDEITAPYQPDVFNGQVYDDAVISADNLFPEVKNVNYFGVDPDECCDEWSGLYPCKSPKYRCNCGGLKSNKGHLGIFWLKRRYGGDGCDYCKGGRCEKECGSRISGLLKWHPIKNSLKKFCCKDCGEATSESCDEPEQTEIFGRPLKSNCRRNGRCDEGCPPKKGCESCN